MTEISTARRGPLFATSGIILRYIIPAHVQLFSSAALQQETQNVVGDLAQVSAASKVGQREFEKRWNAQFQKLKYHVKSLKSKKETISSSNNVKSHLAQSPPYPEDEDLKNWLLQQRALFQKKKLKGLNTWLSAKHRKKIESLGYSLQPREEHWHVRYDELKDFVKKHRGKFPFDIDHVNSLNKHEQRLLRWCTKQKKQYSTHKREGETTPLTEERIDKLNKLGFTWNAHESNWDSMYEELKAYHSHHGDCLVRIIVCISE